LEDIFADLDKAFPTLSLNTNSSRGTEKCGQSLITNEDSNHSGSYYQALHQAPLRQRSKHPQKKLDSVNKINEEALAT